jgi:hypothetical protein
MRLSSPRQFDHHNNATTPMIGCLPRLANRYVAGHGFG